MFVDRSTTANYIARTSSRIQVVASAAILARSGVRAMWRIRQCLLVLGMLAVTVANLFADTCNSHGPINGLNICWHNPPPLPNTNNNPIAPWCSPTSGTQCGFFFTITGSNGWNSLNGQYGWHAYNGNGSAQAFLNTLSAGTGVSIDLSRTSSLHIGFVGAQYRNPTSDNGYYLSTADSTNTPGIVIDFNHPIKDFAMYWGSVDTWNTVTLTDTNNTRHTFSGSQLPNYNSWDPNGNNTTSILVHFSVPSGGKPWTQVAFTSCDTSGVCKPAFEFDNLEWVAAPIGCCSLTPGSSAPVPEPSGLPLLGTAIVCAAGWLRRPARADS